jgi:opacity protein-like surface antigen
MRNTIAISFAAAATVLLGSTAHGADLGYPPPPVPVIVDYSGWYLRGDVGVGAQSFDNFTHTQTNPGFVWPPSWRIDQKSIGDVAMVGIGLGYQFNSWLRADVTAEYRTAAAFKAVGSYTDFCAGGNRCFDDNEGMHQASVVLANAYLDLGTWWNITPFIGVGVGAAHHAITGVSDTDLIADGSTGFGFASADKSDWKFAWAIHAGLAYNLTRNVKLELSYRYLDMGTVDTSIVNCAATGCVGNGPRAFYSMTDFTSQDFRLGMRWMFDAPLEAPAYAPPLVRKG